MVNIYVDTYIYIYILLDIIFIHFINCFIKKEREKSECILQNYIFIFTLTFFSFFFNCASLSSIMEIYYSANTFK